MAKIEGGYILLARKIAESSLIKMRGEDVKVALYLLAKANHKDYKWYDQWQKKEIIIKRGELITSYGKIAEAIQESYKTVRTSIKRLGKGISGNDGFLKIITASEPKRANAYLHISICKFDIYNNPDNYMGIQRANDGQTTGKLRENDGQTTGKRRATNNNDKNDKNDNKGEEGEEKACARAPFSTSQPPLGEKEDQMTTESVVRDKSADVCTPAPASLDGSFEERVVQLWNRGATYKISLERGKPFVRGALERGATKEDIVDAVENQELKEKYKLFEVLDGLCKPQKFKKSIDIFKNPIDWNGELSGQKEGSP